eukprot:356614-Lingulodinium_polyedra.AAC.1
MAVNIAERVTLTANATSCNLMPMAASPTQGRGGGTGGATAGRRARWGECMCHYVTVVASIGVHGEHCVGGAGLA